MNQGYIAPPAPPASEPWSFSAAGMPPSVPPFGGRGGRRHTLSAESLLFLAELLAREKGAELSAAYGVTLEGEKIDLLRPARRRAVLPPAAGARGC